MSQSTTWGICSVAVVCMGVIAGCGDSNTGADGSYAGGSTPEAPPVAVGLPAPGPAMLRTLPGSGFRVYPIFTVSETIGDYQPPGIPDGLGAWRMANGRIRVLLNHELAPGAGYAYELANGTRLTGARISYMDIDPTTLAVEDAGLAFEQVRDYRGADVTEASQINETEPGASIDGLAWLCSAAQYRKGQYGFVDDVFFTHEEASVHEGHPYGGSVWALEIGAKTLWAAPALGRGSWENVTALATPDGDAPDGHVAILMGDDKEYGAAPLYLWIGRKEPDGNFPARNGLVNGVLHVWVADNGDLTPEDWNGSGTNRTGKFVPVVHRDAAMAGEDGYDRDGYLDDKALRAAAGALGAFMFSRPEDLHADPQDGTRAGFTSTGHGEVFPSDDWGTTYLIDVSWNVDGNLSGSAATATILHDSDETGDFGLRNPDNLVWGSDGYLYIQEDRATKVARFGRESRRESAIWKMSPDSPGNIQRIAEVNRLTIVPANATDIRPNRPGVWETSGIIDVSGMFPHASDEIALLANVQAHGLRDGDIGGMENLVRGGQLVLLIGPRGKSPDDG